MYLRRKKLSDVIVGKIRSLVLEQKLKPGDRFFSDRELARHFKVSHITVRAALLSLQKEGMIRRRPRSGTFISSLPESKPILKRVEKRSMPKSDNMIAVYMTTKGHYFYDLMNAISARLSGAGFFPVIISQPPREKLGSELRQFEEAVAMGCRRIVIQADTYNWIDPAFRKLGILGERKSPFEKIVWFTHSDKIPPFTKGVFVGVDTLASMRMVVRHLKDLGHKKIAFVTNELSADEKYPEVNSHWISSFSAAMTQEGLASGISIIAQGNDRKRNDREIISILRKKDRPTAFYGAGDHRVAIVCDLARSEGVRIPEDLALVGTFDTPWAKHYNLTSVSFDIEKMAKTIVDELSVASSVDDGRRVMIESKLVVRDSCGAGKK